CTVSIRPEQMQFADFDKVTKENRLQGVIESTTFLGEASEHVLASGGEDGGVHKFRVVAAPPRFDFKNNAASAVQFDQSDVVVLPR
ncbi:MAG: TOBE domain-containing protein, partial [Planctomycetota bacterium]